MGSASISFVVKKLGARFAGFPETGKEYMILFKRALWFD